MRPKHLEKFEQIISKPRLDSYRGYFSSNTEEAVGMYMWNGQISSCLSTLLSYFEVALRNRIHWVMSDFYSRGGSLSYHWYDSIQHELKPEAQSKIDKIRNTYRHGKPIPLSPAPNPDEIVSRVTFGFWPSILSIIDNRYVTQLLPKIFPNHILNVNPRDWAVKKTRKKALAFLYELNEMRNRIAHHEPLWKFSAIKDTSVNPPVVIAAASSNLTQSLIRFHRLIALLDNGFNAISPELQEDILISRWRLELDFLLTARGIDRYKKLRHTPRTDIINPDSLEGLLSFSGEKNQPVCIAGQSRYSGIFIPD